MSDKKHPHMQHVPELDKLAAAADISQKIGDFWDWLEQEKGLSVCTYVKDADIYLPAQLRKESVLAEFFGIDLKRVERERKALLGMIQRKVGEE